MNNELLLLIRKHTDTMIDQTKSRRQETFEFKMNKQMQISPFSPPTNLVEEGKWLLGVTSFECDFFVFDVTNENNSVSITIPGHWEAKSAEKTFDELNKLIEFRSLELNRKEVRKKRNKKIEDKENKLKDFDSQKKTKYLKN